MTILSRADPLHSEHLAKPPTWLVVVSFTAFLAVLIIPNEFDYPAVLTGLFVFPAMQWACPECRVDLTRPIAPLNFALFLFFLQTVVLPLLVTFFGPAQGVLPYVPSVFSINASVLLINLSYIAFCMGYQYSASRGGQERTEDTVTWVDPTKSVVYVLANFVVGFAGLYCTFRSIGGLVRYFTEPDEYRLAAADMTITIVEAAGSFLKPFLGFSFIMLWCNWANRWGRVGSSARRLAITALMIVPAPPELRDVQLQPWFLRRPAGEHHGGLPRSGPARLADRTRGLRLRRARLPHSHRPLSRGRMGMNELAGNASARQALTQKLNLVEELQVYGQAPQFLAFILEQNRLRPGPLLRGHADLLGHASRAGPR